jgi:hypothetical protein
MKHEISITPKAASERGALDGFQIRCTCGHVAGNSFRVGAQHDASAHRRWHAKRGK